ncbi:MAG: PorV/PorQ family protein [Spirochaetes bacterium]|nr:PorV/PorQ family protein [Spirochaetota bacterium]
MIAVCAACRAMDPAAGSAGMRFLKLPADAAVIGMGDTSAARHGKSMDFLSNPASLGFQNDMAAAVTYFRLAGIDTGINHCAAAFTMPLGILGSIGVGTVLPLYGTSESLELADDGSIVTTGSTFDFDAMLTASYGISIADILSAGGAVKMAVESIGGVTMTGLSFDIGVMASLFSNALIIGASAKNLGPSVFTENGAAMPFISRLGVRWRIFDIGDNAITVAADITKSLDGEFGCNTGMEYSLAHFIYLRAGYQYQETGIMSAGAGIHIAKNIDIDVGGIFLSAAFNRLGVTVQYRFAESSIATAPPPPAEVTAAAASNTFPAADNAVPPAAPAAETNAVTMIDTPPSAPTNTPAAPETASSMNTNAMDTPSTNMLRAIEAWSLEKIITEAREAIRLNDSRYARALITEGLTRSPGNSELIRLLKIMLDQRRESNEKQ